MLASALLESLGGEPIGFVDVGARDWVHPLIDPIASAVAVLGFEPDVQETARMQADRQLHERYARLRIEPIALADSVGEAVLHEISAPTNSSLRAPNRVFVDRYDMVKWQEVGQTPVRTTTLDEVLFGDLARETFWGEALKIDTQGTEHEILEGASRTLRERTLFACVEVSFCELYVGQKLFSEIELLMREHGLSFYGFDSIFSRSRKTLDKRTQWGRERLFQADAYFLLDPFDPANLGRAVSPRQRTILAAFAMLAGYHDFALELLQSLEGGGPLRQAILENAALPPGRARADVRRLQEAVEAKPEDANVLVGKFVDGRRGLNDCHDIPGTEISEAP